MAEWNKELLNPERDKVICVVLAGGGGGENILFYFVKLKSNFQMIALWSNYNKTQAIF